ncbi:MAG: cytochrome c biogenesis protein ResB [Comamonadaceae bacterium]|nr:cytochrome c biogenesis protein ResB [Comamonadaceae bacterium]
MNTVTTSGIQPRRGAPAWRQAVELLSSMRFAIALLTVICIASVIGTVLRQHEPAANYVNQFGPFWAEVFLALKLNAVYSAWWFLLILGFLVISTSLCIARHTPKILADFKTFKEDIRVQSLRAFHHKAEAALTASPAAEAQRMGQALAASGWKVRLQERHTPEGTGWMVAAKAGAANKLGYLAAHGAIVLVCLGGLLDGDLIVRAQTWLGGKSVYRGGGLVADVPAAHRLPATNPTFRGNLMVSEGTASDTAILSQSDGVLLQELPFTVELKKFIVEYYSTGMPKLFASDIVIHDKASGEKHETRVEVNHPARYKGISIYQSSFDDGGSRLSLAAVPLRAGIEPFTLDGVVGGSSQITLGGEALTVEYSGLRVINVENMGEDGQAVDVRKVNLRQALDQRLGAADKTVTRRELRNVGPSISYKLRDAAGQAREYNNYMLPVDMGDGAPPVLLLGVRDTPAEPFRYLRVPADENGTLQGFVQLHAALHDPEQRARAVRRYVARNVDSGRADLQAQLTESATRTLGLFAGAEAIRGATPGGLQAMADFLEHAVPEAEREQAAQVLLRLLNGALFELNQLAREAHGHKPLPQDEASARLMQQMTVALSDLGLYPAPIVLMLQDFTHVQASVFQVARAPGQTVVYLGCLLLIVGIFAMLYVRERRLWIWLSPSTDGARATMALSTNRKTLDAGREFDQLKARLLPAA